MTTRLADESNRSRALTDLGSTLLVEAGAGTGKTALLAGRIAMLMASGAEPKTIAAITFTEMAASELSVRIDDYVRRLLSGDTPPEMAVVLPKGLSEKQRATLERARQNLDELTCTTIHGFCLRLINPYPVQSGLDPGATPMDESSAELSYKTVFEEWLRERLNVEDGSGDPLAECIVLDPDEGVKYIRSLAEFFEGHRSAKALPFEVTAPSRQAFLQGVDDFRTWFQRQKAKETETAEIIERPGFLVRTISRERANVLRAALAGRTPRKRDHFHEVWDVSKLCEEGQMEDRGQRGRETNLRR